jgi:RNA-binding protein Luc7-like 2
MDLGPCPKAHQEKLALAFNAAKEANPYDPRVVAIESEWQRSIHEFVDECDRKINMSQRRLEKTPEENAKTTALVRPCPCPCVRSREADSVGLDR